MSFHRMKSPPPYLRNGNAVVDAFGYWPSFHDALVIGFGYEPDGGGLIRFTLYCWEMTAEVDERGYFGRTKHHRVEFVFLGVSEPDLEHFTSMGNVLDILEFSSSEEFEADGIFRVGLESAMGGDLCGSFRARNGEVLSVVACDEDGNAFVGKR
jgi:hypothetical protein